MTDDRIDGTDAYGHPLSAYPTATEHGDLLGIDVYGVAAYANDETVRLGLLGPDGSLAVPPREQWTADRFPYGALDFSRGDYVLHIAHEHGPWRALTAEGVAAVRRREVPVEQVAGGARPDATRTADLVTALVAADGWARRAELAGELRQAAIDHPSAVGAAVADLVALLDDVAGERERIEAEADDPVGDQPYAERTESFARVSTRRDVAFVVARLAHDGSGVLADVLPDLLHIAGDRPLYDPQTAYKRHLVDALDVVGRSDTAALCTVVCDRLDAPDPVVRERTLNALSHLEQRHSGGSHPLLEADALREQVTARRDDPDERVREAAIDADDLHGFNR